MAQKLGFKDRDLKDESHSSSLAVSFLWIGNLYKADLFLTINIIIIIQGNGIYKITEYFAENGIF